MSFIRDQKTLAGGSCNEDAYDFHQAGSHLDVWVVDGATSVAEREYLGKSVTDPAWFAQSLSRSFKTYAGSQKAPPEIMRAALADFISDYEAQTKGVEIPLFAKPVASLAWIRASRKDEKTKLSFWGLGDCRVLVAASGVIVTSFPDGAREDLQTAPPVVACDGTRDRNGVLLSRVPYVRMMREETHNNPKRAILGFNAYSIDYAQTQEVIIDGTCDILAMSDGFYRLVDEYSLYDDVSLMKAVLEKGLHPLFAELRRYEDAQADRMGYAVKTRDDATAVFARYPSL